MNDSVIPAQYRGAKRSDRAALLEIRRILSDPTLTDSECIEAICRIYETLPDMPGADQRTRRERISNPR